MKTRRGRRCAGAPLARLDGVHCSASSTHIHARRPLSDPSRAQVRTTASGLPGRAAAPHLPARQPLSDPSRAQVRGRPPPDGARRVLRLLGPGRALLRHRRRARPARPRAHRLGPAPGRGGGRGRATVAREGPPGGPREPLCGDGAPPAGHRARAVAAAADAARAGWGGAVAAVLPPGVLPGAAVVRHHAWGGRPGGARGGACRLAAQAERRNHIHTGAPPLPPFLNPSGSLGYPRSYAL